MTIRELLKLPPLKETYDIGVLKGFYYNHLEELEDDDLPLSDAYYDISKNNKVKISYIDVKQYDIRRSWSLAVVYFNLILVMVIQNAGREGDDYAKRFIIDENKESYKNMLKYINSLKKDSNDTINDSYSIDEDLGTQLTSFYNDSYSEF